MIVKLTDVPESHWVSAVLCAKAFDRDFGDRMGIRNGVSYGPGQDEYKSNYYIYKTKSGIVVRWVGGEL